MNSRQVLAQISDKKLCLEGTKIIHQQACIQKSYVNQSFIKNSDGAEQKSEF